MRLTATDPAPGTMNSSGTGNFLLVPIPEYPLLDCVPNKTVKIVVLGASNVGKTGMDGKMERLLQSKKKKKGGNVFAQGLITLIYCVVRIKWESVAVEAQLSSVINTE